MAIIKQTTWKDGDTPYSEEFDDIYYPQGEGLAAARYVFLEQTNMAEMLCTQPEVIVGELGFGTGLNLFALLDLRAKLNLPAKVTFHTFELYPLSPDLVERASVSWPELRDIVTEFIAAYRACRLFEEKAEEERVGEEFEEGEFIVRFSNVSLVIHRGLASAMLSKVNFLADAWFLDGFKPSSNPAMWSEEVIQQISRLSRPGTTLSTWCSAGEVRRLLIEAGFEVEKIKGFGRKRHSIRAAMRYPCRGASRSAR